MFFKKFFHRKQAEGHTRIYRSLALSFFGVSVIIAIIVFYVSFSWATIKISPEVKAYMYSGVLAVQDGVATQSALPGKIFQKELEGSGTFTPSTAETRAGRVSGVVTVVNKTSRAQPLRATTRFLTPEQILFRSESAVVVPAGGQIEVPVQADKEGDLGTIDSSRFTIPGLLLQTQSHIYGVSFHETAGGVASVKKVTDADLERAEKEVMHKLEEKFSLLLDAEKPSFSALSVGSLYRADVLTRTTSHAVGQEADEFTLRLNVRFTAALFDEQQILSRLSQLMQAELSSGYELMPLGPDRYTGTISSVNNEQRSVMLQMNVQGAKLRTDDIQPYHTRDLAGLKKDAIIEYFRGYDDIKDVSVSLYPFWVTRAPLLVDHIKIVVDKSAK